jgi:hypothetical protein
MAAKPEDTAIQSASTDIPVNAMQYPIDTGTL